MASFSRMRKGERAVAIAKDALQQIKSQKYEPTSGTFACLYLTQLPSGNHNLQKLLQKDQVNRCEVCGVGALFVSTVRYTNKYDIHKPLYGYELAELDIEDDILRLTKHFGKDIYLVEVAFELGSGYCHIDPWDDDRYYIINSGIPDLKPSTFEVSPAQAIASSIKFGECFDNQTERLRQILLNIIRNKGRFKPWRSKYGKSGLKTQRAIKYERW